MADERRKPPDHTMNPRKAPAEGRDLGDPRTDPAPGLEYGSLERESASARRGRLMVATILIAAVIVVAILLIV